MNYFDAMPYLCPKLCVEGPEGAGGQVQKGTVAVALHLSKDTIYSWIIKNFRQALSGPGLLGVIVNYIKLPKIK